MVFDLDLTVARLVSASDAQIRWDSDTGPLIDDDEINDSGAARWFRRLVVRDTADGIRLTLVLGATSTWPTNQQGDSLSTRWAQYERALTFSQGALAVDCAGPDHAGNDLRDAAETYNWRPPLDTHAAIRAFFFADVDSAADVTMTFRGSPPLTLAIAMSARAGTPSAAMSLTALEPTQQLAMSARAGDPTAAMDLAALAPVPVPTQQLAMSARAGDPTAAMDLAALAPVPVPTQQLAMSARAGDPTAAMDLAALAPVPVPTQQLAMSARAGDPSAAMNLIARSPVPPPPVVEVEIDWDGDGAFANARSDVSADTIAGELARGGSRLSELTPATGSITLDNADGTYAPFGLAGPLVGKVLPWRAVRISLNDDGALRPLFSGFTQEIVPDAGASTVTIALVDAIERMRLGKVRIAMQEGRTVPQLLHTIADASGWPAGLRRYDDDAHTVRYFFADQESPLQAVRMAVRNHPGSSFYVDREGYQVWRTPRSLSRQGSAFTVDGNTTGVVIRAPLRPADVWDRLEFAYPTLTRRENVAFYEEGSPIPIAPGDTAISATYTSLAAIESTEPRPNIDFTAWAFEDGSGPNFTARVSVKEFTPYAGGFELTWRNTARRPLFVRGPSGDVLATEQEAASLFDLLDAQDATDGTKSASGFRVRGTGLARGEQRILRRDVHEPFATDQTYEERWDFLEEEATIRAYAEYLAEGFSTVQPRPIVGIAPTDDESVTLARRDLGDRVTVVNTDGPGATQIDGDFIIAGIRETLDPTFGLISASWQLSPRSLVAADLFIISDSARGIVGSVIGGPDRIGW